MKTYLLNGCFLIGVSLMMAACSSVSDWELQGLKGAVKMIREKSYEPVQGNGAWEAGEISDYGHHDLIFSPNGNFDRIESFDSDGRTMHKTTFTYSLGKLIEESYVGEDGNPSGKVSFDYISNEELRFEHLDPEGKPTTKGTTWIRNNRVVKQEFAHYQDGEMGESFQVKFDYDKDGNRISQRQLDAEGETIFLRKFEYLEFDEMGNWTKRLEFHEEKGDPAKVNLREYVYY